MQKNQRKSTQKHPDRTVLEILALFQRPKGRLCTLGLDRLNNVYMTFKDGIKKMSDVGTYTHIPLKLFKLFSHKRCEFDLFHELHERTDVVLGTNGHITGQVHKTPRVNVRACVCVCVLFVTHT